MSETLGGSWKGGIKQVCRECNRTVYLVMIDGARVITDPDLIMVVTAEGVRIRIQARRVHGEMCLRYQSEAAKLKALQEAKRNRST